MGVLRGKTNTYKNTENFVGEGDRMKAARDMLSDFVAKNQSGPGNKTGDLLTEFMRGIYGDSPVRGGQLVAEASKRGDGQSQGLFGFNVDPTTGMIATDGKNLADLAGNKSVWKTLGLKEGDMEGLKTKLQDPDSSRKLMEALGGESGAFRIEKGRFEYLDKDGEKKMRDEFSRKAEERLLKNISGNNRDISRVDGESDDSFDARKKRIINHEFREGLADGGINKMVNRASTGHEASADMLKTLNQGPLSSRNREKLLSRVDTAMELIDKELDSGRRSASEKVDLNSKMVNLIELRKGLVENQDGRKDDPKSMVVNVQGNVVVNGGKQKI
jgi:hypothetical protein